MLSNIPSFSVVSVSSPPSRYTGPPHPANIALRHAATRAPSSTSPSNPQAASDSSRVSIGRPRQPTAASPSWTAVCSARAASARTLPENSFPSPSLPTCPSRSELRGSVLPAKKFPDEHLTKTNRQHGTIIAVVLGLIITIYRRS